MDRGPGVPDVVTCFVGFFVAVGIVLGGAAIVADRLPLLLFALVSFAFAVSAVVLGHRGRLRESVPVDEPELEIVGEAQVMQER